MDPCYMHGTREEGAPAATPCHHVSVLSPRLTSQDAWLDGKARSATPSLALGFEGASREGGMYLGLVGMRRCPCAVFAGELGVVLGAALGIAVAGVLFSSSLGLALTKPGLMTISTAPLAA